MCIPMKKLLLASLLCSAPVWAAPTQCSNHYFNGTAPDITNQHLSPKTNELCFGGFAVMFSGLSRTPLWSAEHLTPERIAQAKTLPRKNAFHAERRLPKDVRSTLADYEGSVSYDRGHLSPSRDMPTMEQQNESFSLANIIPQDAENNEILWEGVESAVRSLVSSRGELYVITGPIFSGDKLTRLNGRVLVPTHVFKAIYDPKRKIGAAYLAKNAPGMGYQALSLQEIEHLAGAILFPQVDTAVKTKAMSLPAPTPHFNEVRGSGNSHGNHSGGSTVTSAMKLLRKIF